MTEEQYSMWTVFHIPTSNMVGEYETKEEAVNAVARECLWNSHVADTGPKDFFIAFENGSDMSPRVPVAEVEEAMADQNNWSIEEYDFNALRRAPDGKMMAHVVTDTQYRPEQRFILDDPDTSMTEPVIARVRTMVVVVDILEDNELEPFERAALNRLRAEKEAAYNALEHEEECDDCGEPADHGVELGEEVQNHGAS